MKDKNEHVGSGNKNEGQIGQFAQVAAAAMEKEDISLNQLAAEIDNSYEHTRKLIKGLSHPSKSLLKELCRILKLDFKEMENLVTIDKIRKKFGGAPDIMAGRDPEFVPFYEFAKQLSAEQRKIWMALGKSLQKTMD